MLPLDRGVLIDFNKFEVNSGFIYRQKDNNGYKIIATLSEDNIPIPLANTTVSINIELNEVVTVATMTIESETQGIVSYILPECFVATSGTLIFDISVIRASDSIQLTSPKVKGTITVPVDKDTAIECSDELPILLDLIQQVQDILDQSADFMLKVDYDSNDDGTVNNSDGLQGQAGSFYLDRANHTGTQTASTISDFDVEVSNNPSVVLNTAKVSFPEAPIDGKTYGRKDATWIEDGGGDMTKAVYDPTSVNADTFSMGNMVETATKKIFTDTERTKLTGIEALAEVNQTDAEIKTQYENNANTNVFTDSEKTKLTGIEAGAEVNVQSDWNQTVNTEDDFIKNKPTDITDLSIHSVTELNDVTNAGSGLIITSAERTQIGTNTTNIGTNTTNISNLDTYVKSPSYTQEVFNVSSIESIGIGFESDLTTPVDVSASFVESQLNDFIISGETYNNFADNGVDYANWTIEPGVVSSSNGLAFTSNGIDFIDALLDTNLSNNTTYTFIFNIIENETVVSNDFSLIRSIEYGLASDLFLPVGKLGIFAGAVTTSTIITNTLHSFVRATLPSGSKVAYKLYAILEGDYTTGENANKEIGELKFGLNNTEPQRVTSVGKNLFNKNNIIQGNSISSVDGTLQTNSGFNATDFIRIENSNDYSFSNFESIGFNDAFYDVNLIFLEAGSTNPPNLSFYFRGTVSDSNLDSAQMEKGASSTSFESYKETILYTPSDVVLRSVPNGVQDVITEDFYTKNNNNYTLQSADITGLSTALTNVDIVTIADTNISDIKDFGTVDNLATKMTTDRTSPLNNATIDNVGSVWRHYFTTTDVEFIVPKGEYADLAAAKTDLTSTELIYQLAQPIITDANIQGNLISYENGTKTYDPFIRNEFKYATGITIPNPDDSGNNLKILEVEKAFEIVNDEYVLIDSSRISLSGDLETITISGATNGNFYTVYALLVSSESTVPENSYSLSVNSASQIQQNQVNNTRNSNRILTLEDKVSMLVAEIDDKLLP